MDANDDSGGTGVDSMHCHRLSLIHTITYPLNHILIGLCRLCTSVGELVTRCYCGGWGYSVLKGGGGGDNSNQTVIDYFFVSSQFVTTLHILMP